MINDDGDEDRLELMRHPHAVPLEVETGSYFVEFPLEFLQFGQWSLVSSFNWFRGEDILILEARSALYGARDACVRIRPLGYVFPKNCTRNNSIMSQSWFLRAMRLFGSHEGFGNMRLASGTGIFRAPLGLDLPCQEGGAPACRVLGSLTKNIERTTVFSTPSALRPRRKDNDSGESNGHTQDKKLRQRAKLRVMVDHFLNGTSGEITLHEGRALRTQAAAQQYREASCRTVHGRRAAPRRHEVGGITDASLPRAVADRSSACPAHRFSTQGLGGISRQARRTKRVVWWCGRLWYWTSPGDASRRWLFFSFSGAGGALPFQRFVGLTPSGHCATQSTHDAAYVVPHLHQRNYHKDCKKTLASFLTLCGCLTHQIAGHWKSQCDARGAPLHQLVSRGETQRKASGPGGPSHSLPDTSLRTKHRSSWKVTVEDNIVSTSVRQKQHIRCRSPRISGTRKGDD